MLLNLSFCGWRGRLFGLVNLPQKKLDLHTGTVADALKKFGSSSSTDPIMISSCSK